MNNSLRSIRSLTWQSVAYGIGVIGSQAVIYFLLPFLTRNMSTEEYGAVSVVMSIYTFLNVFTNAGLPAATFRFYNDTDQEDTRRKVLGSSRSLFFVFSAIPAMVLFIFSEKISIFMLGEQGFDLVFKLLAVFLIIDTMNTFGTVVLRARIKPLISSIQNIILILCETGIAVVFVVLLHQGITGYWKGYVLGEIIGLGVMIYWVRGAYVYPASRKTVIDLIKFGIPLIPSALSMTALRIADRYMLGSLAGLDQAAIYDVGYKIGSLILLVLNPFRNAWAPFAFSIAKRDDAQKIYRDVLTYLMAGSSFMVLFVIAFRNEILSIMAPTAYASASGMIIWVAVSHIFLAFQIVISIGPMIRKETGKLAWASGISAIINVVANYFLIPLFGGYGAAISTFLSYLSLAILANLITRRIYPISVAWKKLFQLGLIVLVISGSLFFAETFTVVKWTQITIKILILLVFPALLFAFRFITVGQILELMKLKRSDISKEIDIPQG